MVQLGMPENLWHYEKKRLHEHIVVVAVVVVVAVAVLQPKLELSQQIWERKTSKNQRINSAGQFWSYPTNCFIMSIHVHYLGEIDRDF